MMNRIFNLHERTEKFSLMVIELAKQISENTITKIFISQLVRAATSVGANYCEANNAISKRDFKNKIGICRKEAREVQYWLKMIGDTFSVFQKESAKLEIEAKELNLIFSTIYQNTHS